MLAGITRVHQTRSSRKATCRPNTRKSHQVCGQKTATLSSEMCRLGAPKVYYNSFGVVSLQDDCLYRRVVSPADKQMIYQLLLPDLLRSDVLEKFHDETGHFCPKRTFKLIWPRFYWPDMTEPVKQWCTDCKRCAVSKPPVRRTKPPFGSISATAPMETVAMDFTVLEPSSDGFENVLVVTDVFTKNAWATPTRDQRVVTVA